MLCCLALRAISNCVEIVYWLNRKKMRNKIERVVCTQYSLFICFVCKIPIKELHGHPLFSEQSHGFFPSILSLSAEMIKKLKDACDILGSISH